MSRPELVHPIGWAIVAALRPEGAPVPDTPSDGLVEDLAKGLHADWYRQHYNSAADDTEVNQAWDNPPLGGFTDDPDLYRLSFRNKARVQLADYDRRRP